MNKSQIRARTRQLAGAEMIGLRSDAEMDSLIEEAHVTVGRYTDWRWRETTDTIATVVDTPEYTLDSEAIATVNGVYIVEDNRPYQLAAVTLRDLLTRVDTSTRERPEFYARTGEHGIRVAPTPDAVYTLELFGQAPLAPLTDDSDSPAWDSRWHAVVAYLAASVFLDEEGEVELAQVRRQRADEMLGEMEQFYSVLHDDTPFQMGAGAGVGTAEWRSGKLWSWRG